jgi:ESCRT-I complex subunit TSG101
LLNDAESEYSSIRELTSELKRKSQIITENINRIKYRDKANIEDAVITTTPLYRQLLTLFAEDLTIQDLIFYLGEGLAHKTITLDSFLKQIRSLTRKQFIVRATIQKAREKASLPV